MRLAGGSTGACKLGQRSSSGAFFWAVEKAALEREAIALSYCSKHQVIFEVWGLMS
jgi:hypothetical protein